MDETDESHTLSLEPAPCLALLEKIWGFSAAQLVKLSLHSVPVDDGAAWQSQLLPALAPSKVRSALKLISEAP